MAAVLKAPFPYFGGKKTVASLIWDRLGNVDNYVEPFAGSCAVLLLRPHPPRIETLNDLDHMVANFWRATQQDPEAVVQYADGPVSEVDLHARHRWLVLSDHAQEFRDRMRADPDYFDAKVAGYWCWGLCAWIGGGWCSTPQQLERHAGATPALAGSGGFGQGVVNSNGVHANGPVGGSGERAPSVSGGQLGHGVHAQGPAEVPEVPDDPASKVRIAAHNPGSYGKGVHARGEPHEKRPQIGGPGQGTKYGEGVHAKDPVDGGRPQLADAYSLGCGVHAGPTLSERIPTIGTGGYGSLGHGVHAGPTHGDTRPDLSFSKGGWQGVHNVRHAEGTCEQRRLWLLDWFSRLRDRLRNVRVCCGDWSRVCSSESVTTRLGLTGVYLDPPYGTLAKRAKGLYAQDSLTVAQDVRRWCLERGSDPRLRICLSGYAGEGHEELERHGWEVVAWESAGGYGNRTKKGKKNAKKERLWFSPACASVRERSLFDGLDPASASAGALP